jgi:hypothetical protein
MNRCPACVHVMKQPILWRKAYCCRPVIHRRCVLCLKSFFDEVVNGLLFKLMCKQTLNTFIRIEVIWSIKPTWDMCIIWYFSSFINSNKQGSNETLVCAVIRTSDPLGPCRFPSTLPPLLGLQHALQCPKDFLWLFIATGWTVTIWSSLEVYLRIFVFAVWADAYTRSAGIWTADFRIRRRTCYQLSHTASL